MGGMYELLETICTLLKQLDKKEFTSKDLQEVSDLCNQSIINNITRLVKAGFINKVDVRNEKGFREVRYYLNDDSIKFILDSLYK